MKVTMWNWWCPKCRAWVASCELDDRRVHRECQTKAQWRHAIHWCEQSPEPEPQTNA
jgi:hypothetical protein